MEIDLLHLLAALSAGVAIGLILGLVGGGGSIIAVPLLVYLVGVSSAHEAIGTAAVAVGLNALAGLASHARAGSIKWPCALTFSLAGIAGATLGAELGKAFDGQRLLVLFGAMMVVVGAAMLKQRRSPDDPDVHLSRETAAHLIPRLVPAGLGVGLLAGFFGIGGGFLIVPALVAATGMPLSIAVGTSLVAVSALGLTTAASYALTGYVDWALVALLVLGGIAGAFLGMAFGKKLAGQKRLMEIGFALIVIGVGAFVALNSLV